jgi:hypothetical protein
VTQTLVSSNSNIGRENECGIESVALGQRLAWRAEQQEDRRTGSRLPSRPSRVPCTFDIFAGHGVFAIDL